MNYQVEFSEEASSEIVEAYMWYEKRSEGLGERFLTELDNVSYLLKVNPLMFPAVYKISIRCPFKYFLTLLFMRYKGMVYTGKMEL